MKKKICGEILVKKYKPFSLVIHNMSKKQERMVELCFRNFKLFVKLCLITSRQNL